MFSLTWVRGLSGNKVRDLRATEVDVFLDEFERQFAVFGVLGDLTSVHVHAHDVAGQSLEALG